jgi:HSP20 family protein
MGGQIMQLIKWNPSRDIFGLRNHFSTLFDDYFYPSRRTAAEEGMWSWNPAVDIYEAGDNIIVQAELPGVTKDGISVDVKDRVLTIKGERSADNEVKEDNYFRRERVYGQYRRAFRLPADVDPEGVKAEYSDGVLKVMVPKSEAQKPKQITVH